MMLPDFTALHYNLWSDPAHEETLDRLGLIRALGSPAYRINNLKLLKRASFEQPLSLNEEERLSRIIKRLTATWAGMTTTEKEHLHFYLDSSRQPLPHIRKVDAVPPFNLPSSMQKAMHKGIFLHSYQRRAVQFALKKKRTILAMEMGLGKTLIGLTIGHILNQNKAVTRILIVAPKSAQTSWVSHFQDFTDTPFFLTSGLHLKKREKVYSDLLSGIMPVVIVTPQTFANDRLYFQTIFKKHGEETMLILDEAHKAKSENSLIGHVFETVSKLATYVLALTGTPQPNSIEDLYFLVDRVKPGLLGSLSSFASEYTYRELDQWDSIRGSQYRAGAIKANKLNSLHAKLEKVMLVVSAKDPDVLIHLPKRKDISPYIPLDDLQRAILKALRYTTAEKEIQAPSFEQALKGERGVIDQIGAEGATANTQVLGVKIEQLAICPSLFSETFKKHYPLYESPKVKFIADRFVSFLENKEGVAGVIFCEHLQGLDVMSESLIKRGMKKEDIVFYTGQTNQKERSRIVEDLNEGCIKVVLGQTKSLETGANLQKRASFVAHLSTTWSPDTLVQSTARVYRQGQKREVLVLRPSGSRLEEAKNSALTRKIIQSQSATGLLSKAEEDVLKTSSDSRVRRAHQDLWLEMKYNKKTLDTLSLLEDK